MVRVVYEGEMVMRVELFMRCGYQVWVCRMVIKTDLLLYSRCEGANAATCTINK